MKRTYYFVLLLLLCSGPVFGQDVKFSASVNRTQVAAGEQFEVSFSLNANGERFTPPDFSGFDVLAGPNMSTSMTSINGNTSMTTAYSYYLVANKEGNYAIGSASIVVNGKKLVSAVIRMKVVKGQPGQQNSRGNQGAQEEPVREAAASDLSKSIFIKASVDKPSVYQGEQLTVSYRLYTRVNIMSSQLDKLPELNGFWSQDVKDIRQTVQWRTEIYKGIRYNVADLKQTILYPERFGDLKADPMAMTFIIRQPARSRDVLDEFFGGGYEDARYQVKSAPVTIHVKPLPEAGKPAGFAGAVGRFSVTASADKTELKANEPLNYKVTIAGSGNLKLLKTLPVTFPADFEKYDPKLTDHIKETVNGASGSRTYDYLLIPRHEGNFTIEPLTYSYFNPVSRKYVTLTVPAAQIKVNKGVDDGNVTAFSSADQQDIKLLEKDIRYIKTGSTSFYKKDENWYGSLPFFLLLGLGPVLVGLAVIYRRWDEKNNSDPAKVKSRKAGRLASKHLANAQKQLQENHINLFYEDLFKGLYGYLSDKLNIPYANLDRETIAGTLRSKAVDDKLITELLDTLELCEMARFAPVQVSAPDVFEKAKRMIGGIEDAL